MKSNSHLFLGFVNKIPKAYLVWKSDGDIQIGHSTVNNNKLPMVLWFPKTIPTCSSVSQNDCVVSTSQDKGSALQTYLQMSKENRRFPTA